MSYIRFGARLPSGKVSRSFVFGDKSGLINMGAKEGSRSAYVPYPEMRQLFKTKTYDEIKAILTAKLDLEPEETDYVCESLFEEHKNGEWEKPFDFEETSTEPSG